MKIAVYHMTTAAFRAGFENAGRVGVDEAIGMVLRGVSEGRYVYCARVKFDDPIETDETGQRSVNFKRAMSMAYCATQNVEDSWVDYETTIYSPIREGGQRSSMIGDIFVYGEDSWIVGKGGSFIQLPPTVTNALVEGSKPGAAFDDAF